VSGTDKDGESDRADWVDSLRYPAEIDLVQVVDVTRRSLVIKLRVRLAGKFKDNHD